MKIRCLYDKLVPVDELIPHSRNRNRHSKEQIARLAQILDYQGWRYPIKVSKLSGMITSGHGRLEAAKKLQLKEVPVNFQEYESEAQEYADLMADNAIALWAEIDMKDIELELKELEPFDYDLLGIEDFKLSDPDKDAIEDEVPEVKTTDIVLGDMFQLGEHRLLCGDCTVKENVEKLMDGQKADMVFTDPPYGMNLNVNYDEMFKNDTTKQCFVGDRFDKVIGDEKEFNPQHILELETKQKFIWGVDYFYNKLPTGGSFVAWDKRNETLDKVIGNPSEFCFAYPSVRRMTARVLWSGHHGMQKDDTKKRVHPTQKPTALVEWFFENYCNKYNSVLDIYGGSGSTLIACEKTNRKCFMMEIDPLYCQVIIDRWQTYTGLKAIKLDTPAK